MNIFIIKEKCTGCGLCIPVCLYDAMEIVNNLAVIKESCNLCGACVEACEFGAIVIEKSQISNLKSQIGYNGVCVFAEQQNGEIHNVVFELLGKGRELADKLKTQLSTILIGHEVDKYSQELIERGADIVYLVDDTDFENFNVESWTDVIAKLVLKYKPEIFLAGATCCGRSLFPRVASRLKLGLTADCTGLDIDMDKRILVQTRPAFGGNIMAAIISPYTRPQMATVRYKVMKERDRDRNRKGKIISVGGTFLTRYYSVGVGKPLLQRTKILKFVEDVTQKINLQEADIIVSGGRGQRLNGG